MKNVQRKMTLIMTCVMLGGMLTACGKAEPDPNSGLYEALNEKLIAKLFSFSIYKSLSMRFFTILFVL